MASSVMAMARRSRATSSGDLMTRSRSVTGPASTNFQPGSARPNRKNVWYAVDDSSATDPGLSRRTHDRQEQGDQPLAPPRVVAGEVLVAGTGRGDEEVESAGLELAPGPVETAGEDFRGKGGLLGRLRISDCGLRIGRGGIRNPQSPIRNRGGASRHEVPPLHRPSSS